MQPAYINLDEILWEITDVCKNNCSYCGSKDILNHVKPNDEMICEIVHNICSYPPKEINISGGDPLTLSNNMHQYVTKKLKEVGVVCKILVNPLSNLDTSKLAYYDWIGISVNTENELRALSNIWENFECKDKCTIITNFNCDNTWVYNLFESFVSKNNLCWQVQYTMYDKHSNLAIYEKPLGIEYLHNKINDSIKIGLKVVVADNMSNSPCTAAIRSIGILCNGNVVPCLSMRSWDNPYIKNPLGFGNLLKEDLRKIWEENFSAFRCNEFKCCKDVCKAPIKPLEIISNKINIGPSLLPPQKIQPYQPNINVMYGVSVYGVQTPTTFVYGVAKDPVYNGPSWGLLTSKSIS